MQHPSFASLSTGLSLLVTAFSVVAAAADRPPNVVVILADDLGYADVGFNGARDIPTPNLDRLAASGMRFTNSYVTWVACAPSRASLLTGQDSHRLGFYTNPTPVLAKDQGLPPGIMTVPRALQQRGYITGGIGKWHLGTTDDRHPNRLGFTEWFGFLGGGHDYFPRAHYGAPPPRPWPEHFVNSTLPILRNREPVNQDRYLTDMFSDEAVAFIRRHSGESFFLYLAYNAPHGMWEAPADEQAKLSLDRMNPPAGISREFRRTYAAMITRMDAGIGRVIATLREQQLEERTLVFFLSDNGGGPNVNAQGNPHYPSSNHPLRGFKGTLYEGGIRVPFLASWRGTLPAGVTYDLPVSSLDIGATALALAGGAPPAMRLDGVNLLPHLTGRTKAAPHPRLFWKEQVRGAIREGRYKLITGENVRAPQLYDLEADPSETRSLAAEQPALVARLTAAWQEWNAQMPPPLWQTPPRTEWTKPEYQPALWPEELRR